MQATDEDFGENANITYSLGDTAPDFFSIDRLSGSVFLRESESLKPEVRYIVNPVLNIGYLKKVSLTLI